MFGIRKAQRAMIPLLCIILGALLGEAAEPFCSSACLDDESCTFINGIAQCHCNRTIYRNLDHHNLQPVVQCQGPVMKISISQCLLETFGYDSTGMTMGDIPYSCTNLSQSIMDNKLMITHQLLLQAGWCGNKISVNATHAKYSNVLNVRPLSNGIVRVNPLSINFSCSIARATQNRLGFLLNSELNSSSCYNTGPVTTQPPVLPSLVPVSPFVPLSSAPLYLRISTAFSDTPRFSLRTERCFANPTGDPNMAGTLELITDGHAADQGIYSRVKENGRSSEVKFQVGMFRFVNQNRFFIFCNSRLCDTSAENCTSKASLLSQPVMGAIQSLRLPPGRGPHQVGCTDVMVGQTRKGIFMRLFYPCTPGSNSEQPLWIPHYEYSRGLAEFVNLNSKWATPLLSYAFGSYKVPVGWNAPFLPSGSKYPAIVFSHGLGAFRTVYSAVCMEMASQGFLVAAVEHRDGSASATYFCHTPMSESEDPNGPTQEEWIPYQKLQAGKKEFHLRNPQLHQRANECVRALQLLSDINNGVNIANILQPSLDLSVMKDMINMSKVAVMGHSFGAATALLTLVKNAEFRCAVALDTWMFPLEHDAYPKVKKPVLFINSEKFQDVESVKRMRKICSNNSMTKIMTILGSVHQSQTDFTFLAGSLLNKVFKTRGTIDPHLGLEITNRAALAFLQEHLGLQEGVQLADILNEFAGHVFLGDPFLQSSL